MTDSLDQLRGRLAAFAQVRDWEQFHNPKNLVMALVGETGELVEHFQWLTPEQAQALPTDKLEEVRLEIADILIYLVRLADRLGVDPVQAAFDKVAINELRYPVEKVRGSARRAGEYED